MILDQVLSHLALSVAHVAAATAGRAEGILRPGTGVDDLGTTLSADAAELLLPLPRRSGEGWSGAKLRRRFEVVSSWARLPILALRREPAGGAHLHHALHRHLQGCAVAAWPQVRDLWLGAPAPRRAELRRGGLGLHRGVVRLRIRPHLKVIAIVWSMAFAHEAERVRSVEGGMYKSCPVVFAKLLLWLVPKLHPGAALDFSSLRRSGRSLRAAGAEAGRRGISLRRTGASPK
eukprot:CAMPEP_0181507900 /NCGR_PEP_ID=MMETSP1110-20121109/59419_1 /TAXON_ID=174948 /ORGANISM="Symbiodinium sp., Strain CCMP421" /LENGTH=232 /DNA_ID=CAMNT_0023637145 /DNA_START=356 /DNA_END=1056 /DNA_ORIENTATION=-